MGTGDRLVSGESVCYVDESTRVRVEVRSDKYSDEPSLALP